MKKLLLFACLLASFACTKEPAELSGGEENSSGAVIVGSPEVAARGTLAVKLTPEAAKSVLAAKQTRSGAITRSGIEGIDRIMDEIGAQSFERIFAYDPDWEACYDQTGINCWYAVYFDESEDLAKIGKMLAGQSDVVAVEFPVAPDRRRPMKEGPMRPFVSGDNTPDVSTRAAKPTNDLFLSKQWHYENPGPGAGVEAYRKLGADIDLYDAWTLCTGKENIVVAVIDEPIYTEHPDLKANVWTSPTNPNEHGRNLYNQSDQLDWSGYYYDSNYNYYEYADHGSHVAGVIAAVNNNGVGVAGIAGGGSKGNGVKVMSCQIMGYSSKNVDNYADSRAFEYALKNGAVIAQNSWGYSISDNMSPADIEKAWNSSQYSDINMLKDAMATFMQSAGKNNPDSPIQGGLVLFSAGNDGDLYQDAKMYPGAHAPLIAVGAMDWCFQPAYYTDYGTWVDITAPGGDALYGDTGQVLSTILCDRSINYKDGRKSSDSDFGYGWMQGTSMACPHVSGVAALGLAYASQLGKKYTAEQYKALLLSSVYPIDPYLNGTKSWRDGNGTYTLYLSNYVGKMGGGCIDALKLLLAIKGTPALYAQTGKATEVDFSTYFGGKDAAVRMKSAEMSTDDSKRIGLAKIPAFSGKKLTLTCANTGTAMMTIRALVGDTEITREFAIVVRPSLATNGGWL